MSARRTHPDRVELALWVAKDSPDGELREHVDACKACAHEAGILAAVANQLRDTLPEIPDHVRERLRRMPDRADVAPPTSRIVQSQSTPTRVRGVEALLSPSSHILVASTDEAEISVQAQSDVDCSTWSFDGRVWLSALTEEPVPVFLVLGEHVVASLRVADGEMFHIEETVSDGWQLELHMPSGSVVCLEAPSL